MIFIGLIWRLDIDPNRYVSRTGSYPLLASRHGANDSTRPLPVTDVHANARPSLDFQNAIGVPAHTIQPVITAVRGVSFGLVLDVLCRHRCRVNVHWVPVAFTVGGLEISAGNMLTNSARSLELCIIVFETAAG